MRIGEDANRAGHHTLPHTADVILKAWAPTRADCLVEAVAALTESFADTSHVAPTRWHAFRLAAATDEQALVSLLEEALYVLDARCGADRDTSRRAADEEVTGRFALADVARVELVGSVPKGVALSGLSIGEVDGAWHCTVTVDV